MIYLIALYKLTVSALIVLPIADKIVWFALNDERL